MKMKSTNSLTFITVAILALSSLCAASASAQTQVSSKGKNTLAAIDSQPEERVILPVIESIVAKQPAMPAASLTSETKANAATIEPSSGVRSAAHLAASLASESSVNSVVARNVAKASSVKVVPAANVDSRLAAYAAGGTTTPAASSVRNIKTNYGENQSVRISQNFTNMIVTPFEKPNLVGRDGYEVGQNGSTLLVTATTDKPFWVSISDSANPMATPISLTMIPQRDMASQTIIIQNDQPSDTALNRSGEGVAADYVQMLRDTLKDIAQQKVPRGFSLRPLTSNLSMANGFKSAPVELYSGSRVDVQRYRLTNTSVSVQVLAEEAFGHDESVMAVSIFPNISVGPGQTTDVLIVTSKAR